MLQTFFIHVALLISLLILTPACNRTEWVASVGNQRISKADVDLKREMMRLSNPRASQKEALQQIIDYKLGYELLQGSGARITQKDVSDELNKVKNEAKKDKKTEALLRAYQRNHSFSELYLYPRIVASKISWLFENDKAFNEEELKIASTLISKSKADPAKFASFAADMNLPFFRGQIKNMGQGVEWEMLRSLASTNLSLPKEPWFASKFRNELLNKIEANRVFPEPVPFWFGFLVLRKEPSDRNSLVFSVAVIPRKGRSQWLSQKGFSLPVTRFDGAP